MSGNSLTLWLAYILPTYTQVPLAESAIIFLLISSPVNQGCILLLLFHHCSCNLFEACHFNSHIYIRCDFHNFCISHKYNISIHTSNIKLWLHKQYRFENINFLGFLCHFECESPSFNVYLRFALRTGWTSAYNMLIEIHGIVQNISCRIYISVMLCPTYWTNPFPSSQF